MTDVAIVANGGANIASLRFALDRLGASSQLTADPDELRRAPRVILPGVGAAADAMDRLRALQLVEVIPTLQQPLLGICLGMQLLFGDQEEGPTTGLGLLGGDCVRLPADHKVPHMGWNTVRYTDHGPFAGRPDDEVYFVHSYMVRPNDPADVAATTDYGVTFPSVVAHGTIWGTQFHPEKSGDAGLALLDGWLATVREGSRA
jgi:glutamine amidotransferase